MCIILDANRLGKFFAEPADEDAGKIHEWLHRKGGSIVYSTEGDFARELGRKAKIKLQAYFRAGRAKFVPATAFDRDSRNLQARGDLRSNDPHILALARASGARLLYTGDQDLIADFKDKRFINNPRGKIYSGVANTDLLTKSACGAPKAAS